MLNEVILLIINTVAGVKKVSVADMFHQQHNKLQRIELVIKDQIRFKENQSRDWSVLSFLTIEHSHNACLNFQLFKHNQNVYSELSLGLTASSAELNCPS